jgi:hypothetical protein
MAPGVRPLFVAAPRLGASSRHRSRLQRWRILSIQRQALQIDVVHSHSQYYGLVLGGWEAIVVLSWKQLWNGELSGTLRAGKTPLVG